MLSPRRAAHEAITSALIIGPFPSPCIPALCERLRHLIGTSNDKVVSCDVSMLAADLDAVELLARLHQTAQQLGRRIRFEHTPPALVALIEFCGLADTLALTS